jgi:hypothetical protein
VSEADLALWPAVPASALADFDAEIGRDRRAGQLKPLGRTPATAAKSLKS